MVLGKQSEPECILDPYTWGYVAEVLFRSSVSFLFRRRLDPCGVFANNHEFLPITKGFVARSIRLLLISRRPSCMVEVAPRITQFALHALPPRP